MIKYALLAYLSDLRPIVDAWYILKSYLKEVFLQEVVMSFGLILRMLFEGIILTKKIGID